MKFLVSFQQKHISVFQLSKFSNPTQKSFPSFPVKDSQAAISVVVSIVVVDVAVKVMQFVGVDEEDVGVAVFRDVAIRTHW